MMTKREQDIFDYLMRLYRDYWDRNDYNRENYNEDLEYYIGYRNSDRYPLAYNHVFNRILPIIYTLLSRFMDQLYQSGNIVSVRPRKSRDVNNAKNVEAVLNYQLESLNDIDMQGGSYLTMLKWMFNAVTFGKGIVKAYWRKEDRISPRRIMLPKPNFDQFGNFQGMDVIDYISQEMQTVYDGPYVEVLHNKLFVPHPEFKSIQLMPACFVVYSKSMDYVKGKVEDGTYRKKCLSELGKEGSGAGHLERDTEERTHKSMDIEGALTKAEIEDKQKSPDIDIIEAYAKLIFDDAPYEVGSGLKIKGREEEAIIHIGNYSTILSIQRNEYGIRPLFDIPCYMHPEMYWDIGLIRLTKGIQEQINTLANTRMQNVMMMINQMIKVQADADIDPQALKWKPFGIIPVEDMADVQAFGVPDYNSNMFREQEDFYQNTIHDLTGMYPYNMGQTPQRQERVGVIHSLQSMGEARAKLMLMSMDYLGIRPLLKYMMVLNTFHLPSGFEYRFTNQDQEGFGQIFGSDIHPDFDYAARYTAMEPALGKQFRAQQLVQMAQMWMQSPWVNQFQMIKTVMELLDIQEADSLLKSPQQFQQEMAQQQKAQMMQAQMPLRLQQEKAKGKLMEEAQEFQFEKQLKDQEFQHNVALEAIKQEVNGQR